jgi:hypothetical protein
MGLAIDLHEHLIHVPAPLGEAFHPANPLSLDVGCKHWPKAVPPQPHGLMTYVDTAFEKQVFDISQTQWESHVHHHDQANDFGR